MVTPLTFAGIISYHGWEINVTQTSFVFHPIILMFPFILLYNYLCRSDISFKLHMHFSNSSYCPLHSNSYHEFAIWTVWFMKKNSVHQFKSVKRTKNGIMKSKCGCLKISHFQTSYQMHFPFLLFHFMSQLMVPFHVSFFFKIFLLLIFSILITKFLTNFLIIYVTILFLNQENSWYSKFLNNKNNDRQGKCEFDAI